MSSSPRCWGIWPSRDKLFEEKAHPLKTSALTFCFCVFLISAGAAEFSRQSTFDSVESFIVAAKAFQPGAAKSDLSSQFTAPELGEGNRGTPVTASIVESCDALWSDDTSALLMAIGRPATQATRSCDGVLFLLVRENGHWKIADLFRFTATGKYADISAELTAQTSPAYRLGSADMAPIVTIKKSDGGRWYSVSGISLLHVPCVEA
jgi:hypothetical protein